MKFEATGMVGLAVVLLYSGFFFLLGLVVGRLL